MLAGRADGSANGTGSANLAIGEIASPGLFKIFASNPSNAKNVLDEFIVAKDSPIQSIADLKGKKVGSGPGIQNATLAKAVLERAGATGATVVELAISQHVAAVAAGQLDACYAGAHRHRGPTERHHPRARSGRHRQIRAGRSDGALVRRLGLADHRVPEKHPEESRKFIAAYARGIELIRNQPDEARPYMKGYTAIEGPMTEAVPLAAYTLYNEFSPSDIQYFQKFFDLFADKGIFAQKVDVASMLYKG